MPSFIGKATVLVVEDDPALREMYRDALNVAGHTVVAVEDGIDALRCVESAPPNLIVLDLMLPRLGGHDVQRELASHAETRDIPIVVVTGTETRTLNPRDFDCILKKPVNIDVLVAAVDLCLRSVQQSGRALAATRRGRSASDLRPWQKAGSSRTHRHARTVLAVDDEVAVQALLRDFLEEKGFRVETAGGVGEAISVLERRPVDAVVLDVRMPQRSGLELLDFIRFQPALSDIPVLVLTGAALTPEEEATIARDRGYVFHKSDNLESLAAQLDQLTV